MAATQEGSLCLFEAVFIVVNDSNDRALIRLDPGYFMSHNLNHTRLSLLSYFSSAKLIRDLRRWALS